MPVNRMKASMKKQFNPSLLFFNPEEITTVERPNYLRF